MLSRDFKVENLQQNIEAFYYFVTSICLPAPLQLCLHLCTLRIRGTKEKLKTGLMNAIYYHTSLIGNLEAFIYDLQHKNCQSHSTFK